MTAETFIKAQLAAHCHQDAFHMGGVQNMMAIAFVMRNRQRAGWFGGDWMEILHHADEVAATIYPLLAVNLRDVNVRSFLQQVDDVYSGLAEDKMTEGALYYCELHRIEREWFHKNIVRSEDHKMVATVGQVAFFK